MQDLAFFHQNQPTLPDQEHQLKCPRCDSTNTKFCYYNNYNLSQPRHFCKNCKRYWTKGGTLRNIPVGGGTRKSSTKRSANKKQRSPPSSSSTSQDAGTKHEPQTGVFTQMVIGMDQDQGFLDTNGVSFSSLMTSNEDTPLELSNQESFLSIQGGGSSCWGGGNGWSDLSMYTHQVLTSIEENN
ncbi:hypothetical protein GIB67_011037 [Kingdonia uniflora]|uniref:Dof zinc finger protein n=1 Tax=Kingdonia uniflora TaxID=39325 RepID=A0A7J7L6G6_9MAGN|nr:hypothetical protein GIB67_011037 [Kingdonia uniflora]